MPIEVNFGSGAVKTLHILDDVCRILNVLRWSLVHGHHCDGANGQQSLSANSSTFFTEKGSRPPSVCSTLSELALLDGYCSESWDALKPPTLYVMWWSTVSPLFA